MRARDRIREPDIRERISGSLICCACATVWQKNNCGVSATCSGISATLSGSAADGGSLRQCSNFSGSAAVRSKRQRMLRCNTYAAVPQNFSGLAAEQQKLGSDAAVQQSCCGASQRAQRGCGGRRQAAMPQQDLGLLHPAARFYVFDPAAVCSGRRGRSKNLRCASGSEKSDLVSAAPALDLSCVCIPAGFYGRQVGSNWAAGRQKRGQHANCPGAPSR